jgi:hypothetical protein
MSLSVKPCRAVNEGRIKTGCLSRIFELLLRCFFLEVRIVSAQLAALL